MTLTCFVYVGDVLTDPFKLPHLFIPSKTATQVPEFAMEDLPLGRIASLVPEFAVKDLPCGRTLMMMNDL